MRIPRTLTTLRLRNVALRLWPLQAALERGTRNHGPAPLPAYPWPQRSPIR
ncbi:hypothetical protein [Pseudonocardia sp. GCM10023141]|uniref:hypothetical protein n=1 Tax=Pseudonocardia sp. GCM10023141 TaxID=3252653 RepID=UPI0036120905